MLPPLSWDMIGLCWQRPSWAGAPRALGFDSSGREMLSYLPGEIIGDRDPWPAWVLADSMLVQVGQGLRRLHDLTADFRPPGAPKCP